MIQLNYVPLLQIQREIQGIPRSPHRFREYLRTIKTADGTDVDLVPLLLANPMAKDHVTEQLDALLTLDADGIGARAASEATEQLADVPGVFRAALVVADDLAGGGTNRYAYEFETRHPDPGDKRYWVTGILWSSEPPTAKLARETVLAAAFRTAYVLQHGPAGSLEELMIQEGYAMAAAGCEHPNLASDELEYSREVLRPHLGATDMRTQIEFLFGDVAARSLGFSPRRLSPWAGLAVALADAHNQPSRSH